MMTAFYYSEEKMITNNYILVDDTDIIYFNRTKAENGSSSIVYRDGNGTTHVIDLSSCTANRNGKAGNFPGCVGERNSEEFYFLFYTSGFLTKIVFRKAFVFRNRHGRRSEQKTGLTFANNKRQACFYFRQSFCFRTETASLIVFS